MTGIVRSEPQNEGQGKFRAVELVCPVGDDDRMITHWKASGSVSAK